MNDLFFSEIENFECDKFGKTLRFDQKTYFEDPKILIIQQHYETKGNYGILIQFDITNGIY